MPHNEVEPFTVRFQNFPRAKGALRSVMDAFNKGEINSTRCAEWLLELSLEGRAAPKPTDVSKPKLTDTPYRAFYRWMVDFKSVTAADAVKLVRCLETLGITEETNLSEFRRVLETSDRSDKTLCLSALTFFKEFKGG